MIKLSANMCKKVPIAGLNYSSQSFMAGLEVEISDNCNDAEIRNRIRDVYLLLEQSVNEQIKDTSRKAEQNNRNYRDNHHSGRGGRDGRGNQQNNRRQNNNSRQASKAQVNAVYAICKANGISRDELSGMLQQDYGKNKPEDLELSQASEFIGILKDGKDGR